VLVGLNDLQLMMNGLGGFGKTLGQQDLDPAQRFDGGIRDGRFEPADLRRDDPVFESRVRIGRRVLFGHQFRRHQSAIVFVGSQHVVREPADRAPAIEDHSGKALWALALQRSAKEGMFEDEQWRKERTLIAYGRTFVFDKKGAVVEATKNTLSAPILDAMRDPVST
jgi:hypothetical protein